MIRVLLAFVILSFLFGFGIQILRSMSGKEKWQLTKLITYSIICALLAIATLTALVVFF